MVDYSKTNTPEVCVGFPVEPANNLVTQPMFTPSKIGGFPANIAPLPPAAKQCDVCQTKLTFICQVLANVDELSDFHRLLHVFGCLSEKCIGKPSCIRVFREVVHDKNPFVQIVSNQEYDQIFDMEDYQIQTTKFGSLLDKIVEPVPTVTKDNCILQEYLLDDIVEDEEATIAYLKHSERIKSKL